MLAFKVIFLFAMLHRCFIFVTRERSVSILWGFGVRRRISCTTSFSYWLMYILSTDICVLIVSNEKGVFEMGFYFKI
jgi:hypothetical protein